MTFPVWVSKRTQWTAGSDEPRGGHVHGAADIADEAGTELVAAKSGNLWYYWAHVEGYPEYQIYGKVQDTVWKPFPFANYRLGMYGVIAVLAPFDCTETWVYCHMELGDMPPRYDAAHFLDLSEKKDNEHWFVASLSEPLIVSEGEVIGYMGNFGKTASAKDSSGADPAGAHLHVEVHPKRAWCSFDQRARMEDLFPEHWAVRNELWRVS